LFFSAGCDFQCEGKYISNVKVSCFSNEVENPSATLPLKHVVLEHDGCGSDDDLDNVDIFALT